MTMKSRLRICFVFAEKISTYGTSCIVMLCYSYKMIIMWWWFLMMLAMVSGKAKKRKPLGFIVIVFIVILPTFSLCYNIIVCFLSLSHSLTYHFWRCVLLRQWSRLFGYDCDCDMTVRKVRSTFLLLCHLPNILLANFSYSHTKCSSLLKSRRVT